MNNDCKTPMCDYHKKQILAIYFCCEFLEPPAPPTKLHVKDRASDSVTISWAHPKYFEVDTYHVEIWYSSSNTWENATTVPGQETSETLGGLEPETIYNITMYSENRYGVGKKKSNALQVETKKGISLKNVHQLTKMR